MRALSLCVCGGGLLCCVSCAGLCLCPSVVQVSNERPDTISVQRCFERYRPTDQSAVSVWLVRVAVLMTLWISVESVALSVGYRSTAVMSVH